MLGFPLYKNSSINPVSVPLMQKLSAQTNIANSSCLPVNHSHLTALSSYNKAFINKNKLEKQPISFGYNFFLKQIEHMHCAYCGEELFTHKKIEDSAIELAHAQGEKIVEVLTKLREGFPRTNIDDFLDYLKGEALDNKEKNFKQLFNDLCTRHESKLITKQNEIYDDISKMAENLPNKYVIDEIILKAKNGTLVKRNEIIEEIKASGEKLEKRKHRRVVNAICVIAEYSLPKSYDDRDAFIVKYCKDSIKDRSLYKLIEQIVYPLNATVEHVVPHSYIERLSIPGKEINTINNYIVACSKCNEGRSDENFRTFINAKPERKVHLLNYIKEIIKIINTTDYIKKYSNHPLTIVDTINKAYGENLIVWGENSEPHLASYKRQ